jgi:hypothetical protein
MKRVRRLTCLLALSACALGLAPAAAARPLPGRAQVEAALNAHDPPLRYSLTRARCLRLPPDPSYPGRILCRYFGTVRRGTDTAVPVQGDCAYLRPARRRGWRVDAYPDADMCE